MNSPLVDLLCDLIRIPSVNPDGVAGTDRVGEKTCAEFLQRFLSDLGAEAELREVLPGRPNVVARFPSNRPGKPRLLLAPHTDTVSVVGMTIDPFSGEVREGKVWGRGASDTKGPMAAMLDALRVCRDLLPELSHEIWFAGLMGEEAGQHGSAALAAEEHFDFVIVGEPTNLQTVHTHKGAANLILRTTGRAAHSSTPQLGENAIEKMLDVLAAFRIRAGEDFSPQTDPVLGPPTFSIGIVQGGSKINIVPDACEAQINIRTVPGQNIQPLLDGLIRDFPGLIIDSALSTPLWTDPTHPLIRTLESCGATPIGAPWFCDGALFSAAGMAAVALGPGSLAQAHTADEWITVEDLERGTAFFQDFLARLQ